MPLKPQPDGVVRVAIPASTMKLNPFLFDALAQIAATEAASLNRWNELPTLISINAIKAVKPGATVLLTGTD